MLVFLKRHLKAGKNRGKELYMIEFEYVNIEILYVSCCLWKMCDLHIQ